MEINFLRQRKITGIILGILAIVLGWIEFYLFYPLISTINSLRFSNIFEGLILMVRFVLKALLENVHIKASYIWLFIFALLVVSLLISILCYIVFIDTNDFIEGKEAKNRKIFCKGLLKVWGLIVLIGSLIVFGGIFLTIVAIPALVVTASFVEGETKFLYCMFFDLVTILTIASTIIYIRIPIWNAIKNSVTEEKTDVSNNKFKKMVIMLIILDVAFILSRVIMIALRLNFNGTISTICQFLVIIFLNVAYFTYKVFNIFKILKD